MASTVTATPVESKDFIVVAERRPTCMDQHKKGEEFRWKRSIMMMLPTKTEVGDKLFFQFQYEGRIVTTEVEIAEKFTDDGGRAYLLLPYNCELIDAIANGWPKFVEPVRKPKD